MSLVLLALSLPAPVSAWQIHDPLHNDCHERMTQSALTQTGYVTTPPEPTGEDKRLPESLQFDIAAYDANPYAWALILGVRFPDLYGAPDFDFDNLARVHNAIDGQGEHCLRDQDQDGGDAGNEAAIGACKQLIERMYWQALATLDANGQVNADQVVPATVYLQFIGKTDYPVSGFYFYAGRGLHAVQDSFTHTYRTKDWRRVQHVFNWVEQVSCTLNEGQDGHGHETLLDDCDAGPDSNTGRMQATTEASADFLAALTAAGSVDERRQRLDAFFDKWFGLEKGCTTENGYCASEEHTMLMNSDLSDRKICAGCGVSPRAAETSAAAHGALALLAAIGLGLLGLRRRRSALWLLCMVVAAGMLAVPTASTAEEPTARVAAGYHTEVRASMSVQNPAYGVGVMAAWAWKRFEVGAFGEFNPWYSAERQTTSAGATNVGLQAHYLHPLGTAATLRCGVGLGVSVLNADMVGSKAGTTGYYLNLRLLGIVIPLTSGMALTIDGFDLALPAPQMVGWPILYAQHRFSAGLQF